MRTDALPDDFLTAFHTITSPVSDELFSYICNLLWCLWKARCNFTFQGKQTNPQQILTQVSDLIEPIQRTDINNYIGKPDIQIPILSGKIVALVDGSWDQHNNGGIAALIYNPDDELFWYHAEFLTAYSPFQAETEALNLVINYCQTSLIHLVHPLVVFSDCKNLIDSLRKKDPRDIPCWKTKDAFRRVQEFQQMNSAYISLQHVPRKFLERVHQVANQARTQKHWSSNQIWNLRTDDLIGHLGPSFRRFS